MRLVKKKLLKKNYKGALQKEKEYIESKIEQVKREKYLNQREIKPCQTKICMCFNKKYSGNCDRKIGYLLLKCDTYTDTKKPNFEKLYTELKDYINNYPWSTIPACKVRKKIKQLEKEIINNE